MQHPVARVVRDKLDCPGLRNAHQHGIARPPSPFRNPPALCPSHIEGVTVHMHWMVVHTKVHEADAHAFA